jgi:hypothetical protein
MGKCFLIFLLYFFTVYASTNDTCIIITEVMFDAVSGNNEFIELYNMSETETIDLQNFAIKYYTSNPDTIISARYGTLLKPKSYAVIFEGDYDFATGLYKNIVPAAALLLKISDNAFGSNGMSNTSNRPVWLINSVKDTVDVYTYSANNSTGYSDEKIIMNRDTAAVNWKNSTNYLGTPGYKNSVVPIGNNGSDIIVNEIMFAPHSPEPEWFELYNRTPAPINLKNWTITDIYTTPATVKINTDIYVSGNSILIIARDSNIYNCHRYILSPVLLISFPALNNDADGIILNDNLGDVVDSVKYDQSWGGNGGYSLERISPDISSLFKQNWGTSRDVEQSTPGRINSLTEKVNDLSVSGIYTDPRFPVAGNNVTVSATVKNDGTSNANNFTAEFYSKTANEEWKLMSVSNNLNLNSGDSVSISSSQKIINIQGKYFISVRVLFQSDQDTLNNYVEMSIEPGAAVGSIIINEIMYDPASGEPEWVELKNISSDTINFKNWSLSDVLTNPTKAVITDQDYFLSPDDLFVATRDTSFYLIHPELSSKTKVVPFGTLGNTLDGVIIYDYRDGIVDSMMYKSSWGHKKGYSIERISDKKSSCDSSNWVVSLSSEKSTPGKVNSVINIPEGYRNDLVINEIMFDPAIGNNEFIEFINLKKDPLNIGGWSIEDQHANKYFLSDSNLVIMPGSYFILAADSLVLKGYNLYDYKYKSVLNVSGLGLTTEELVLLKDLKGNIIDSVYYSEKWHNKNFINTKGRSLERINPWLKSNDRYNWNTCVDPKGATPGAKNSIYTNNETATSGITVKPNPFSPDNDGYEDCSIISYSLRISVSQVNIKIYDSHGRLVRVLSNNMASGTTGSVIFDGLGDDRMPLRMGIYIVFLEALNSNSGANEILKTTIVVARKLN